MAYSAEGVVAQETGEDSGWDSTVGWLESLNQAFEIGSSITATGANMSEDVSRGIDAQLQIGYEREEHAQDMKIELMSFLNGDTMEQYYIYGAIAVALIVFFKK